jgi:hypothetical protein
MSTLVARAGPWSIESWGDGPGPVDAYCVRRYAEQVTWSEIARRLADGTLGPPLTEALAASSMRAFFWECTPWPVDRDPRFEFVLADAPSLARTGPDPSAFETHLGDTADALSVRVFDNLGGDARLVVPCPGGRPDAYGHLATFVRHGPRDQVDALWIALGETLLRPATASRWVSTSGLGVPWLHLRIDQRPKYYTHAPYRDRA